MSFLAAAPWILAELAIAAAFGFGLLRPALGRLSLPEKIAWAIGAGALLAMAAALVSIFFGGPDPFWLLAAGAALCPLVSRRRTVATPRTGEIPGRLDLLLLAVAAAGLVAFLLVAVSEPLWTNDYLAIWGLKAKMIALTHSIPRDLLHDPSYGYSHPEYPLGVPLLLASLSWARWNDHALAIAFPWFAAAVVAAVAGVVARRSSLRGAAVAAALTGLLFPLFRASNVGLADIPFALAGVLLASAYLDAGDESDLRAIARLAVAALLAALLKREGLLLAVVFAVCVAFGSLRRRAKWRAMAALVLPAMAAVAFQDYILGPRPDRDFQGAAARLFGPEELFVRLGCVARTAAAGMPAFAMIGMAGLALFFAVTPRVREDRVIAPVIAQVMIYMLSCAFYAGDPAFLVHTALGRITSALVPVLAIAVGSRVAALSENRAVSNTFGSDV